jgi:hypothetical protein
MLPNLATIFQRSLNPEFSDRIKRAFWEYRLFGIDKTAFI